MRKLLNDYQYELVVGLVGVALAFAGFACYNSASPDGVLWRGLLIGVGTSLVAGAISAVLLSERQKSTALLGSGIEQVWEDREHIAGDQWIGWLAGAKGICHILGVAASKWLTDPNFRTTLEGRLKNRVQVHFLLLSPRDDCQAAAVRAQEEQVFHRDTIAVIRETFAGMWQLKQGLDPTLRGRLHIWAYQATPSFGALWVNDVMVVTHYLPTQANLRCPAFLVRESDAPNLFSVYRNSISAILENQARTVEITDENIADYLPIAPIPASQQQ